MPVQWIPPETMFGNAFVHGNVLIDAGVQPSAVAPFREEIEYIVLTHCHYDHTAFLREIANLCNARVCIHGLDAPGLVDDGPCLSMLFGGRPPGIAPDRILSDGDRIGGLQVIHTPGHTPGSICLYDEREKVLFSGDTVFTEGGFGRFDFPGGSREQLLRSIEQLSLMDIEGLYPGHGFPVGRGGHQHILAALEMMTTVYG